MAEGTNAIIDLSHHNIVKSWDAVRSDGILAIIHKSTEGTVFVDDKYQPRRKAAKNAGFLWGAYHFVSAAAPKEQVEFFLDRTKPESDELLAVDYEPSSAGMPNMTLSQLVEFIELLTARVGRVPVLYGGHLLREALGDKSNPVLAKCPLWYARYADAPIGVPKTWAKPTIWQYTDGKFGNDPKAVAGISGHVDRDIYFGSAADLKTRWPLT